MPSFSERTMMIWSLCLIISLSNRILVIASSSRHLCRPYQKDALLEFKNEFHYNVMAGKTESWRNNTDCCSWKGISCDPKTGNVVELDLQDSFLNGPLRSNSSLFRLQHLQTLDLGLNNLTGILPASISNLKYLRNLTLYNCNLFGKIPSSLGNLSYLTDLDLSVNDFNGELPGSVGYLNRLTELRLVSANLSGKIPLALLNLSELTWIDLRSNKFEGMLPSNMSSLSKLIYFEISGNSFSGSVPPSLFMIPTLVDLDLGRNDFTGPLEIGDISSPSKLRVLYLGENNFNGPVPRSLSKLASLVSLDLSFWNTRRGNVDFTIFLHLKSLKLLHLSNMNTKTMVDLSLLSHLMSLGDLDLSGINLKINPTLNLPSPIKFLALSSCSIAEFPKFIQSQTRLIYLDISANQIEGQVPEWLWKLPVLWYVNISQNSFNGFKGSEDVIQKSAKVMLDISSNTFQNPFPLLPVSLMYFSCSDNRFPGEISREICKLVYLDTLVLSNNNFNGSIPRCFEYFNTTLSVLNLRNNSISGVFPAESICVYLRSLDVGHNKISGELPKSLINCTRLEFLNVEDNMFNDKFPFWLRLLPNLQILVLRSNHFHGKIFSSGASLIFPKLRIFDISRNLFTGVLPSDYFAGWSAMSSDVGIVDSTPDRILGRGSGFYHRSVALTNKGLNMELVGSGFKIYKSIDVSGNRIEGDIPTSIGLLKELIVLNMSNNVFTGGIPPSLASLTNLQSLDLSQNRLSGEIPPELGKLTFLARMNFSYNMLEGPIPQGTQIQSQNSSSFGENPGLCGFPLEETCGGNEEEATKKEEDEEKEEKDQVISWISAAIGYVPGVLGGLAIGHILHSYKFGWFMSIFHYFT
ncbi:receptor-like protein 48 isoform X2 [Brassica rapa]|uniref:receptor-like protein 48 isoform X2 n=1 Tax=Brassica campestris TaxID=3711 RepID=UPI0008723FE3|nr:receptor-like protein 48 isoform X2 [Brassica rapa]